MMDLFYRNVPPRYKEFAPQQSQGGPVRACVCLVSQGKSGCGRTATMASPAPMPVRSGWSLFPGAPQYKAAPAWQSQTCGDDTPPGAQTQTAAACAATEEPEDVVICEEPTSEIHIW